MVSYSYLHIEGRGLLNGNEGQGSVEEYDCWFTCNEVYAIVVYNRREDLESFHGGHEGVRISSCTQCGPSFGMEGTTLVFGPV